MLITPLLNELLRRFKIADPPAVLPILPQFKCTYTLLLTPLGWLVRWSLTNLRLRLSSRGSRGRRREEVKQSEGGGGVDAKKFKRV